MKKVMLIMAAALLMMTQCKKENETPNGPAEGTMKMTVTAGPGRTSIDTGNGAITWSAGDKLYVSDGSNWLGSLTLVGEGGTANGTFTGDVAGIGESQTTCHFFYLGHDNGMTEPTGSAAASISMAAQDGTLAGAMKYHLGYGNTSVTVTEGEATGSVIMNTKIAIAHINFTNGTSAYTGSVTMGGTGISNTMTVSPDGTFTGNGDGGITIGATTEVDKYVTLIPTTGTDRVDVAFSGDATGSMTFLAGIQANKFYGMSNAMAVTVKPVEFTVDANGTKVKFAPGNLYWDGSAFRFEANQWSTTPASDGDWSPSHVSHFKWSDAANAVTGDYNYSGDLFCASNFTVAGDSHTWRTLSKDEWDYLLNSRTNNASSLRAWKDFGNNVKGLVILPDGTDASVMSSISSTSDLATSGAVFLPAAGRRSDSDVNTVGLRCYYWSSTPYGNIEDYAYRMYFNSGLGSMDGVLRSSGSSVRLVRSAS